MGPPLRKPGRSGKRKDGFLFDEVPLNFLHRSPSRNILSYDKSLKTYIGKIVKPPMCSDNI
jgi:hypothetical protein